MMWGDIAMLTASATLMNHLGLVEAVEGVVRRKIPVVGCAKCCSFWTVLAYCLLTGCRVIPSVAVSFSAALAAVWLELMLGYIDTLYTRLYEKIYTADTGTTTGDDPTLTGHGTAPGRPGAGPASGSAEAMP